MGTQVLLTIPDDLYRRAQRVAQAQQQEVTSLLIEALIESPILEDPFSNAEENEDVAREMQAYETMHAELWDKYPGQYVAIQGGNLVDRDHDPVALSLRINEKFPDEFVWISKVEEQPIRVLRMPSFRLVR